MSRVPRRARELESFSSGLEIVEVDEAEFGHQIDDPVVLEHLHCNRDVGGRLRSEVDVRVLLGERRTSGLVIDCNNVQLNTKESQIPTPQNWINLGY